MFKALLDTKFEKYITLSLAKFIMFFAYAVATLVALIYLVGVMGNDFLSFTHKVILLPLIVVGWIGSLIAIRLWLEFSIAIIKTSEETGKIRRLLEETKKE